jgi:sulfoxide reductase heme-binding subunit YedZ
MADRAAILNANRLVRLGKPLVFALCLIPLAMLVFGAVNDDLGANPTEAITHATGDWALRLLLLTLAMTPLKRLIGRPWPIRFRRMLGLFAFFYVSLHFLVYAGLDQRFGVTAAGEEVAGIRRDRERRFGEAEECLVHGPGPLQRAGGA